MNKKEVMDFLLKVFNNVNYWLDYAERKLSYITTLFTIISGLCAFLFDIHFKNNKLIIVFIIVFFLIYIASLLLTLDSFSPIIDKFIKINSGDNVDMQKDNLIFYGDIAKYSVDTYKDALINRYSISINSDDYDTLDLINQIVVNSKIANKKYEYSKIICRLLSIILVFSLPLAICILFISKI